MRLIDIVTTASSNMFRSKLRTSLTIIAIFIGAFTLTLTNGLGSGISSYIDKQVGNLGAKGVLIITAAPTAGFSTSDAPKKYDPTKKTANIASEGNRSVVVLTAADVTKIRATSGIKSVEPYLSPSIDFVSGPSDEQYVASVTQYVQGANYTLKAGSQISNNTTQAQAMIPLSYVTSLGFKDAGDAIGKTIIFGLTNGLGEQVTVPGTIVSVQDKSLLGGTSIQANTVLTKQLYAAQTTGLPAAATQTFMAATAQFDPSWSEAQITTLKNELKAKGYMAQTVEDQIGTFKTVINAIVWVLNGFAIIALLAASFGIINTLLMSVQERTKEIGLMKAMGMSGSRIFLLFSGEAVMLGFWGSLLGVGVAMIVGTVINQIVLNGFLKDLVGLQLFTFPPAAILIIMGIVMGIAFLAGTLPAYRAARQSPIDSLRYE